MNGGALIIILAMKWKVIWWDDLFFFFCCFFFLCVFLLLFFSMGAGEIFQGEGSGGGGGGKRGAKGREVGVMGEGSGGWGPPCPPPPKWELNLHVKKDMLWEKIQWVIGYWLTNGTGASTPLTPTPLLHYHPLFRNSVPRARCVSWKQKNKNTICRMEKKIVEENHSNMTCVIDKNCCLSYWTSAVYCFLPWNEIFYSFTKLIKKHFNIKIWIKNT